MKTILVFSLVCFTSFVRASCSKPVEVTFTMHVTMCQSISLGPELGVRELRGAPKGVTGVLVTGRIVESDDKRTYVQPGYKLTEDAIHSVFVSGLPESICPPEGLRPALKKYITHSQCCDTIPASEELCLLPDFIKVVREI